MCEELDLLITERRFDEKNKGIWCQFNMITSSLAQELYEQVRLISEPTPATKIRGDYKTGKYQHESHLYIVSQYCKDKI
jgi:midasin